MLINIRIDESRDNEFAATLSKQQRDYARIKMIEQFAELLTHSPRENIYWIETKTDLVELAHEAYASDTLKDRLGRPFGFKELVKLACTVFHLPMPQSPYALLYKTRIRKGVRQKSFFSRYCWLLYRRKSSNPLHCMLRRYEN